MNFAVASTSVVVIAHFLLITACTPATIAPVPVTQEAVQGDPWPAMVQFCVNSEEDIAAVMAVLKSFATSEGMKFGDRSAGATEEMARLKVDNPALHGQYLDPIVLVSISRGDGLGMSADIFRRDSPANVSRLCCARRRGRGRGPGFQAQASHRRICHEVGRKNGTRRTWGATVEAVGHSAGVVSLLGDASTRLPIALLEMLVCKCPLSARSGPVGDSPKERRWPIAAAQGFPCLFFSKAYTSLREDG